ncbi:MAG: hypothetical protein JJ963_13650 [Balneolaceae bacterium]|nr:hypothetical protein [Balneolaceae bacterium]
MEIRYYKYCLLLLFQMLFFNGCIALKVDPLTVEPITLKGENLTSDHHGSLQLFDKIEIELENGFDFPIEIFIEKKIDAKIFKKRGAFYNYNTQRFESSLNKKRKIDFFSPNDRIIVKIERGKISDEMLKNGILIQFKTYALTSYYLYSQDENYHIFTNVLHGSLNLGDDDDQNHVIGHVCSPLDKQCN